LIEVKIPQIGSTVGEITITRWLKQERRKVIKGEPLFEIMTSKINIEVKKVLSKNSMMSMTRCFLESKSFLTLLI
jgi:hypothetical protein